MGTFSFVSAVQLENWRLPYYRLAADMGLVTGSPSGMFWDNLDASASFAPALWPDSLKFSRDHWTVEPYVTAGVGSEKFVDGEKSYWHAEVLNDIRFRRLTARQTLDIDSRYDKDPSYPWMQNEDRTVSGTLEEAYVQADWNWGFARFGRLKRNWGPFADRSLLLSSNPHTYDALEWQVHNRFFEFRHLFGAFPRQNSSLDSDAGVATGRFLTAHSLNFILGRWASLGITETVLFTRTEGMPDLQYVNPLSVYFITNTNGEGNGNLMMGFQGMVHPFTQRVALKGQVIIDDYQVDNNGPGDQEPNHWGADVGAYWTDPLPFKLHSLAKVEYRYLSRWLYTVADGNAVSGERYIYLGQSLGEGRIDGDEWLGAFSVLGRDYWLGTLGLRFARQGSSSVSSRWSDNRTYDTSTNSLNYRIEDPFSQRDDVSTTISPYLEARACFRDYVDAGFSFSNRFTRKPGSTSFEYDPVITAELSVHYADFFLLFGR